MRCARTAWAWSSTSCRTTWPSRPPTTAGGGTCWPTGRPAATQASSTSTGTRRRAASATSSCCRCCPTTTVASSRRATSASSAAAGASWCGTVIVTSRSIRERPARWWRTQPCAPARTSSPSSAARWTSCRPPRRRIPTRSPVASGMPRCSRHAWRSWQAIRTSPRHSMRLSRRAIATSTPSMRSSRSRTTGSRSGARPPATSATGGSSTSTSWSACGWRTRPSSRRRMRWSCAGWRRVGSTACASTIPTGSETRPATSRGCARRRRTPGSWPRRSWRPTSRCPRTGRSTAPPATASPTSPPGSRSTRPASGR
jgi:hypothetical protein